MEGFSFQTKEYICTKTEEELGIGEKRVKWKECCSKSFLRSVFLFLAEEREEGTVLASPLSLLLEISAFLLIRCFDLEARVEERKKNAMALILPCGTKERILSETEWLREGACNRCAAIGVRGAFLSCATVMDPMKGYHAAFSLREEREERELASLLDLCGLTMKRGLQKGKRILYLKDSSQIEDLLSLVGAERFAMRMMDCKIEKSIRGNINRRQNLTVQI